MIKLKDIIEMFAIGTGLTLPDGSINGAPKPKKVKKTRKKLDTDKKYHYKPVDEEVDEDINIPIKVGDTVLMGKYKNKKVKVKSIGKDEHGMPTINGKKATTFRINKKSNIFDEDVNVVKKKGKDGGDYRDYDAPKNSDIEQPYRPKKKLKTNETIEEKKKKKKKKKIKFAKRPSQRTRLMRQQRRYYFKREKAEKELKKSGLPGKIATTKMGRMRVFFVSYKKPNNFWGTGRVLSKENNIPKLKQLIENETIKFKDKTGDDKEIDIDTALQYGTHPPKGYQQYQHPAYKALLKQKPDFVKNKSISKTKKPLDKKDSIKKDLIKKEYELESKIAKNLVKKYGLSSKVKFTQKLDDDNYALYNPDTDEIEISLDKNKDPKQFLISVLHEIDHARDAKRMGAENYKDDYTLKGQLAVDKGGDFHDDNPYEIKAEKFGRSEYEKIKNSIDTKQLMKQQDLVKKVDKDEKSTDSSVNVFGVEKENTKFVFDKSKPDNISEETIDLGKKLGINRNENGVLSFHVDSPSRGPYSESQTHDTKYFDKLYFGNNQPNPIYEDDESDKITEWVYDANAPLYLNEVELNSIKNYQDGAHRTINSYLRELRIVTPGTPTEEESKIANARTKQIDRVFQKLPTLPESIKVHRRAWDDDSNWISQMNEGDIFEDKGFVSTSTDSRLPDQYGDVKFEIIVPAGQKALYMNSLKSFSNENQFDIGYQAEKEILLPRGKKFRVVKKEGKKFNYKITLEMVGDTDE